MGLICNCAHKAVPIVAPVVAQNLEKIEKALNAMAGAIVNLGKPMGKSAGWFSIVFWRCREAARLNISVENVGSD